MTKKELVFLGPPASGKGTQTSKLSKELKFPHIDTGSLLRKAIASGSPEGITAKSFIKEGQLVPVEIVTAIIKARLKEADCENGFILDGFPRSTEQAEMLEVMLKEIDEGRKVDFEAIYFDIDEEHLLERIIYRRSCPDCGKIYNLRTRKPKNGEVCDKCGVALVQRKDDTAEIAHIRFETYFRETAPLIDFYDKHGTLKRIDANGPVKDVWARLLAAVNEE